MIKEKNNTMKDMAIGKVFDILADSILYKVAVFESDKGHMLISADKVYADTVYTVIQNDYIGIYDQGDIEEIIELEGFKFVKFTHVQELEIGF
jgi:hypothetical protein